MGNSWNHHILASRGRYDGGLGPVRPMACSHTYPRNRANQTPRTTCPEPVVSTCLWDYVTGRAGRISSQMRRYCVAHTRRFAERHGIESMVTFAGDDIRVAVFLDLKAQQQKAEAVNA